LFLKNLVAEENVKFCKDVSIDEGAKADNEMVNTSKLPLPSQDEDPSMTIRQRPLTFDPSPLLEEGEDIQLAAANEQAKLMQWHHLGCLSFPKAQAACPHRQNPL
jgi:hypothetical protein